MNLVILLLEWGEMSGCIAVYCMKNAEILTNFVDSSGSSA